jgi:CHAT domain-containing protein/Tfp pilus assembly protein PilF
MRRVFGWMLVVILCCAAGGGAGAETPEARLWEAQAAFDEATKLKDAGRYSEALARAEHALALREAVLGGAHPDVAPCLLLVGELYQLRWDLAHAEPLYQRALALQEAALGDDHPDVAQALNALARLYKRHALYGRAEPLYQRALALREAALGHHHPDVARTLNDLAFLYQDQGLYGRAEPLYQRALALQEAALGKDHPDVASSLFSFASLYVYQGLYDRAEPLLQRALALREAALGHHHADVARTLGALAFLYAQQGLYGRAEPLYQRALVLMEAALGHHHPGVASLLNNLARLYAQQGLYGQAEPLFQRALALREAALGNNNPSFAGSLNNLAHLYAQQGLYDRAEPLFQRALTIMETLFGKSHPDVAVAISDLAGLYLAQGLYDRAEPLLQRALAAHEAYPGSNYPDVALTLGALAELYLAQGSYARAEPLFQRALSILEATHGGNHPWVARTLHHLARLRLAQGRLAEALPLFTRSFALSEQRLRQEALGFSESRLSSFLHHLRADEQVLYALLRAHPEDARVRHLALSAALLLKGRSVEEAAHISRTLYRRLGPEDRGTFERLRGLRTQLATLSLAHPGSSTPEAHSRRLQQLADEGDALEADLARRSAPLRALTALPPPADIVERVAASLPQDSALVELIAYRYSPLVPQPGTPSAKPPAPLRYLALVLFPDASTRAVDLGPAEPIDRAASRLRNALANREAAFHATARDVHALVFQPLLPLLGTTRRLLLSPDGQLGFVPFAALHDGQRFLLDSFDFVYLTSGRELLPRPQDITPSSAVFVLADPDFTASPRAAPSASSPPATRSEPSASLERFFSRVRASLPSSAWVPLPGTRQEGESIQRLLPQARLFLGPEATKERLLHLPTPGILHVATHGFFLEDAPTPEGARAVGHFGALGDSPQVPGLQEPLLRSGLALAGARAPVPEASTSSEPRPDAALVTALELAGLDLWGTQLVVLSACDTGRGEVQLGQGVSGLRRSLVVAGAETVVMSLWKVNDDSTRVLMDMYYRNLLAGQGRASALREAMRSLRGSRPHPHDWAPFIAQGSDAPLRAFTPPAPAAAEPWDSTASMPVGRVCHPP